MFGNVSGSKMVTEAQAEEPRDAEKIVVWELVPRARCVAETGRPHVGTRWMDANDGDEAQPTVGSGLVAYGA